MLLKVLFFLVAYAVVIPLWSVASMFLSAPNDVGFYAGVVVTAGICVYVIFITRRLINTVTTALGVKTNSES